MATLDSVGRVLEVNEALANWLEKTPAQLTGQLFWETLDGFLAGGKQALADLRENKSPFARITFKSSSAHSPSPQWFSLETARGGGNCFARLSSSLPPLSELEEAVWDEHLQSDSARRNLFLRLQHTEAQLDRLLRRSPCVVFHQRPDFSLQFASPNIQELTGVSAADWASQPRRYWELVHELDAVELRHQFQSAAQTGREITNTYRIRHAQTGRVGYVREHRHPVVGPDGRLLAYEVIWLDVTRQTVAERRLSAAAWKETLAVLTLGLAHDFRNMMAGIHSLSESYVSQIDESHPFQEGLMLIQKNSLQASQLVQRMISLHLGQTGELSYHDLNEVTRDMVDLVAKILPRRILLGTELAAETLPVYADVVELRQVVINLLLNAADAMPKGGNLTLLTSRHAEWPHPEHMKGVTPRLPCVRLTIKDSGAGIKERHLSAIFDPFFTTKAKGSGLGLYNARIALEKHRGAISVESQEGQGTSFHLWLPQADLSAPTPVESGPATELLARRTLLLAGQTGEILDQSAEFLRSHNYHVVLATTPESLPGLLQSGDYQFAAVMLLAEPPQSALGPFLREIRQPGAELRVVLKLAGCNPDDLGGAVTEGTDLLLNSDLSDTDMLQKLDSFLK